MIHTKNLNLFVTSIGNRNKSVVFIYKSRYKAITFAMVYLVVFIFAVGRKTFWRREPKVWREKNFYTNRMEYFGTCRFISGKWFGKWEYPEKFEDSIAYSLGGLGEN